MHFTIFSLEKTLPFYNIKWLSNEHLIAAVLTYAENCFIDAVLSKHNARLDVFFISCTEKTIKLK